MGRRKRREDETGWAGLGWAGPGWAGLGWWQHPQQAPCSCDRARNGTSNLFPLTPDKQHLTPKSRAAEGLEEEGEYQSPSFLTGVFSAFISSSHGTF